MRARVLGVHQIDELCAERRGGADLCLDVGRDVLDLIGIDLQLEVAVSLPRAIAPTRPTWTPRILTLALVSITRPARSEVRVTGT